MESLTLLLLAQVQWIQVGMKIITAAISYATAIAVYKLIPLAMVIPSPIQLEKEVKERKHAQLQLQKQYQRTVALARVTKEIRKSLKFQDICNATASQCIDVFRADLCSVYRCDCQRSKDSPKMGKSSVQNMKEFRGKEKDFEEDGDQESHTCYLISEYDRLSPEEAITDRQGAKSVVTPPLLSIVGYLSAVVSRGERRCPHSVSLGWWIVLRQQSLISNLCSSAHSIRFHRVRIPCVLASGC